MKRILLLSLLLLPIVALAQYPTFSNKQKLGVQTTGDGLIYRGNSNPNYNPSNINNAYFYLDTTTSKLYLYNDITWQQVYPTAFDTSSLNIYLKISDTTAMLLPYFRDSDTTSLNLISRFALKLNISDTVTMLTPYLRKADTISLSNRIDLKLNISDTTILSNRITTNANNIIIINNKLATKLDTIYTKFKDVVTMIENKDTINIGSSLTDGYGINIIGDSVNVDTTIIFTQSDTITLSNRIDTKLNVSDTVSLSNRIDLKLNTTDTINLSNRIDLKLNKSDTISLSNRIDIKLNASDTVSLSNRINTKLDTIYVNYPTYIDTITNKDTIQIAPSLVLTEGFGINIIADSINIDSAVILATQQKQIAYVKNQSGVTMYKGQAVYSSGSSGDNKLVTLASSATEQASSKTFGVVETDSIPNGGHGYIITFGVLSGFNTNALTEGLSVYLSSTPGQLTSVKPQAPLHIVTIGVCIRQQQNTGSIFVKIQNGFEFDELHDVRLTDLVNKASIYYNLSEKLWRDTTAALLVSDTASMLNPYLRKLDTLSLSNRINLKFNTADTSILGYVTTYSNQYNINGNKTFNNTVSVDSLNATKQAKIQSLTVGKGGYAIIGGITGGISSTAFGFEALKNNTLGDWNTAIGYQALLNNDTAWNNVAIGNNALKFNIGGQYNTAIGVDALDLNVVGNYNTAIGYSAGNGSKGNNNIFIGSNTSHSDSINNTLMIGGINAPLLSGILSGNKKLGVNINPLNLTNTFEVNSPISDAVKISSSTNSTNLELANNSGNSVFIKSSNRNMTLQTDATALMYLNGETNRVGILTMSPEQALEVAGTIRVDSLVNNLTPVKLVGGSNSNDLTNVELGTGLSFVNDTLKIADNIINSGDTATLLRKDYLNIDSNVLVWTEGNKKLLPYFTQIYRNGQLLKYENQYTITSDSIVTLEEGSYKLGDNITVIAIDNIIALAGSGGVISLSGHVSGSGTSNINTTINNGVVTNSMLAGSISNDKLNTITTVGKVSNSATTATDVNTANHIVLRDASGNFSAGTITASLNGNANTSTTLATGRTIGITGDLTYTSPSFNGSTNVTAVGTLANSGVTANTYTAATVTVDAKGRITSASSNTIPTVNDGTLTMNVSGNGLTGTQTFTANQSSAATFTVTSNATNINTPSTIVYRDASGNFSAGSITASNFFGNATSSTNSTNTTNVLNYLNSNEIFKFKTTNATNVSGQRIVTTPGTDFSVARIDAAQTFLGVQTFSGTASFTGSVTGLTSSVVGLGNVDNTSDLNKPISTATQTALNLKQNTLTSGVTIKTINNVNLLSSGNLDVQTPLIAATSTVSGFLLANDWVTFNSKQNALNGTGFIKASGTSISYDNTSYLPLTGGTLTGALSGTTGTFNTRLGVGSFVGTPTLFTSGNGDQEIHFTHSDNVQGRKVSLRLTNNNSSFYTFGGLIYAIQGEGLNQYNRMSLGVNTSEIMHLTRFARVGIMNDSPSYTLDVNGTFNATGNSLIGGTLGVTGTTTLSNLGSVGTGVVVTNNTGLLSTATTVGQTGLMTTGSQSGNTEPTIGYFDVTHNLGANPSSIIITPQNKVFYVVIGKDASVFRVQAFNLTTGNPATSTAYSIYWLAIK